MPPMMSLSSHTFWIDYESGKLLESFTSGAQAKNPVFIQGDTAKVEVHLLRRNGSIREEISIPAGATLKMGIGRLESQPTAGTFKIGYKGTASAEIPFNASASALQTALNGIPAVASEGGISVETAGDAFLLTWNSGTSHDPLTSDPDELFPSSQVILVGQVVGDVQKVLLHLQQSPVAFLQTFTAMGDPVLTSTLLATIGSKKVYRISIAPNPAGGSFYISGTNSTGTLESPGISVNATSTDVLNALPATIQTDASVIKSGTYSWDISISSANSLTADGSGLIGWLGVEGLLSLNTVQIHEFLNARESAPAVLEIMVSESSGETTILQTACTIVADLIDEGSIAPLDLTPPLSEGVANNRFIRKDLVSAPSDATQDIVWQNLGVTIDGSSVVDAIDAASTPSGGNPFATIDDLEDRLPLSGGAISGDLTISGRAGIGGGLAVNPANKLAIYNGNIVFSNGYGIAFGDGTTQTTAATTPDLSGYAPKASPLFTGTANFNNPGQYALKIGDPASPDYYNSQSATLIEVKSVSETARIGVAGFVRASGTTHLGTLDSTSLSIVNPSGSITLDHANGLRRNGVELYARKAGDTFTGKVNLASGLGVQTPTLNLGSQVESVPSFASTGDLWISNATAPKVSYRIGLNNYYCSTSNLTNTFSAPQIVDTTATSPAIRITQKGTGSALVVEDQTTPDSDALIVDANGNLGIGVSNNPGSIWSGSTYKMEVAGNAQVTGLLKVNFQIEVGNGYDLAMSVIGGINFPNYGGTIEGFQTQTNPNTSGGFSHNEYPSEIIMKLNGNLFAIPARQIV